MKYLFFFSGVFFSEGVGVADSGFFLFSPESLSLDLIELPNFVELMLYIFKSYSIFNVLAFSFHSYRLHMSYTFLRFSHLIPTVPNPF
jgi:hypothetical protein